MRGRSKVCVRSRLTESMQGAVALSKELGDLSSCPDSATNFSGVTTIKSLLSFVT